jgi:cellulose synthase/poly-beta-1,6-N-acetylglucosamine synthase-like glycosyltransferase/DNA-binding NarL/FixJ family response regulator
VIRVLVADDHLAVRDGVRALLADESEISVVGEAADGPSTLALARSLRPDLIVLDNSMPGLSGLDVSRKITQELPGTGVVFLTMDPGLRDLALAAGATAFVPKDAPSDELLRAIRATAAALTARRQLADLRPEWRRVIELLLGTRTVGQSQMEDALGQRAPHESPAATLLRLGLVSQADLADVLAHASETPLVSLTPYPEIAAAIDPTESRLSSPRLVDPVEHDAARLVPLDLARALGVVVTASDGRQGVVAMADPLDDAAFAEAERQSRLRLTRVTATPDEIQDTIARAWSTGGSRPVIWTGDLLSRVYTNVVLGLIMLVGLAGFGFLVRDALSPRFAFSLFALLCGLFFFLYALKYYVTIASVILITLFGDPARFTGRNGNGHANGNGNGNGHTNGNGHGNGTPNGLKADGQTNGNGHNGVHKEGYRTLRGENLSEVGSVVVNDPWQRIGEIRLPADRQPFVSIHLALYNENRVVDRLLTACTSFDYENYEVIVADDSTDETVSKLARWAKHPRVRVIHRSTRKGFKGGALQEALRRMNPRTEYVMVFDADFVPPADAIWHFLDYFGRLAKAKNGNGTQNGHATNGNGSTTNGAPQNGDRLAVVQGYQWHMLNASENWITKGVRAEFSGSYVLERAGQELFGAMKMISGSVYMIRADVLRKLGWSTSITEDWELTIRLYLAGYKVLYTPYIQAPAECVSKVHRLIKQRMRWAEGHTYNVKKYFWPILRSPNLTWQEKLEFVYYAPYYFQSVLFTIATIAWIVGVLVLGQKLPMWGEALGWSLVVSNALALPLMNLTGVLLEGSLRRDALGLLSFIGLSWLLVPFQAYASIKALFEREEGGWVRTPKSGHVTETLERFRLVRLMPWELPKRRRAQTKKGSGAGRLAAAAVVVLAAAGIITVGALSVRATAASGTASEADFAIPALLGTAVPLAILGLGWLRMRRRVTAIVLAFTLGLGTNVVFLANAVPVIAVTDNSSTFTFRSTTGFNSPNLDMVQGYTPAGAGTTCPSTSGRDWTCAFASDTFTTGQTMGTGTAQTTLYLKNATTVPTYRGRSRAACASGCSGGGMTRPPGTVDGDLMLAFITISPKKTPTPPAGWNFITSASEGNNVSTYAYWRLAAAGDPVGWTWTWSGSTAHSTAGISYSGVDTVTPVDTSAGASDAGGSTHTAPSVTTAVANEMIVTAHALDTLATWTPPTGMTERSDHGLGGASMEVNEVLKPTAGATGTFDATSSVSGSAANITVALRPGAAGSCAVGVQLQKVPAAVTAPALRDAESGFILTGTTLTINKPVGTAEGDVLVASIGMWPWYIVIGAPADWTLLRRIYTDDTTGQTTTTAVYWKVATGSEPASYSWTLPSVFEAAGGIQAFSGVNTTTPIDIERGQGHPSGFSFATPNVTTALPNDLIVGSFSVGVAAFIDSPGDMTEAFDQPSATPPNTWGQSTASAWKVLAAAGATGAETATIVTNPAQGSAHILALASSSVVTLATGTATISATGSVTAVTTDLTIGSEVTFATGDRVVLKVKAPNDSANCDVQLDYDGASVSSRLVTTTIVPEGVVGLLLLAPALPLAMRWWKRRRP